MTMPPSELHTVELFGVPRLLAGAGAAEAAGATLGELAADLLRRLPALSGPVLDPASGWPNAGYAFVVGERFTRDPAHVLANGASILLVASVAGG
jgi:molybdopterin converting factor small subunit